MKILLTLKPFGPIGPIVPGGPLVPVDPAGPGRPSSPGPPCRKVNGNISLFAVKNVDI